MVEAAPGFWESESTLLARGPAEQTLLSGRTGTGTGPGAASALHRTVPNPQSTLVETTREKSGLRTERTTGCTEYAGAPLANAVPGVWRSCLPISKYRVSDSLRRGLTGVPPTVLRDCGGWPKGPGIRTRTAPRRATRTHYFT